MGCAGLSQPLFYVGRSSSAAHRGALQYFFFPHRYLYLLFHVHPSPSFRILRLAPSMATATASLAAPLSLRPVPAQARTARRRRTTRPFLRPTCAYALQEGQSRRFHRLPCGLDLEVIAQCPPAAGAGERPPLVFVHGSFHAAWCWAEHWLPFFSRAGFPCYALSLRAQVRKLSKCGTIRFGFSSLKKKIRLH